MKITNIYLSLLRIVQLLLTLLWLTGTKAFLMLSKTIFWRMKSERSENESKRELRVEGKAAANRKLATGLLSRNFLRPLS